MKLQKIKVSEKNSQNNMYCMIPFNGLEMTKIIEKKKR